MRPTWRWLAGLSAGIAVALASGCSNRESSTNKPAPAPPKKSDPSAWKAIETPVPVGQKLPCTQVMALDKIGAAVGYKLEVVDQSSHDPEATSVCRLNTVKAPGRHEKGQPTPGDELATVSLECWDVWNVPEIKTKCLERGEDTGTDVGDVTCVRKVKAGEFQRFIVTTLEPDTRCKVVVNAGPSNYDLALTKATARALLDTIDKETLRPPAAR